MKYIIYIMVISLILYIPALFLSSLIGGIFGLIFGLIKWLWYIIFVKLWFISLPVVIYSILKGVRNNGN